MAKYIDADNVLKLAEKGILVSNGNYKSVVKAIMEIPAADAVEVVRCKDCKNSEHWYRDRRRCFLWSEDGVSVFGDGFCNYAERRTDEQIW